MREYELFIDESGEFTEGLREDAARFPSQIVGLVAPGGKITERSAEEVLRKVFAKLGEPLPDVLHAHDWPKGERFQALVLGLVEELAQRPQWQPVRLENREGLGFGAMESTYTRMVAELAVRAIERLSGPNEARLTLTGARFMAEGDALVGAALYLGRLQEHFAFAALRRGLAAESARWKIGGVNLASGRTSRPLQLCDVLSNASHSGYGKLGDEAREALRARFGAFDFRMTVRDLDRRVDEHVDEGSFGLALRALAEELIHEVMSKGAKADAERRLSAVLDGIAALPAAARGPQLSELTAWLHQLVEQRRDAGLGLRAAAWIAERVEAPLRARGVDGIDAFSLALRWLTLTAANHHGALREALDASNEIDTLVARLAGRWEHGALILECLVAQGVHLTDRFDHEAAARRMSAVAGYYAALSSLLGDALEGVFPADVRSEQRGRALGTWMQAEMYAGLSDPNRFELARRLNEEAMVELGSPEEIARQHQYRCQLETFAGDAASARSHLAASLGVEPSHAAIAGRIAELPSIAQGFALLHWLRLGALVLGGEDDEDRTAFGAALKSSKVHTLAWCTAEDMEYPAHGIRRQLAIVLARRGDRSGAESMLGQLRGLDVDDRVVLGLIEAVAHLEVAGLIWSSDAKAARRVLEHGRSRARELRARAEELPAVARMLERWEGVLDEVDRLDARALERELLGCGRLVGY